MLTTKHRVDGERAAWGLGRHPHHRPLTSFTAHAFMPPPSTGAIRAGRAASVAPYAADMCCGGHAAAAAAAGVPPRRAGAISRRQAVGHHPPHADGCPPPRGRRGGPDGRGAESPVGDTRRTPAPPPAGRLERRGGPTRGSAPSLTSTRRREQSGPRQQRWRGTHRPARMAGAILSGDDPSHPASGATNTLVSLARVINTAIMS